MKCIHLGSKSGSLVAECCNGKPSHHDLYACLSPRQSADWCVTHNGTKSLGTISLDDGTTSLSTVAVCRECPFREQLTVPISQPTTPVHKGAARLAWEARRERRNPAPGINRVVVVDCNHHGYGDACVMAWLAKGTAHLPSRVAIHATGHKKDFLEMLGQNVMPHVSHMASPSTGFGYERNGSTAPRYVNWCASFGVTPSLSRPTVHIPPSDSAWAVSTIPVGTIGLSPQTTHVPREWGPSNWKQLYESLKTQGMDVAWLGLPDGRYSDFDTLATLGVGWQRTAAAIQRCSVVVGNDSAIAHLAGTLDVPTVVVLGPTTEVAFSHMPSVRCVATPKRVVECSGCSYGYGFDQIICSRGCAALANVTPERVLKEIEDVAHSR